jgi:membrane protein implicated in regulation of membrane protease activity
MEGPLVFLVLVVFSLIGTAIVAVMDTMVFWLVIWAFVGLPVLLVLRPMLFYRRYREQKTEPRTLR